MVVVWLGYVSPSGEWINKCAIDGSVASKYRNPVYCGYGTVNSGWFHSRNIAELSSWFNSQCLPENIHLQLEYFNIRNRNSLQDYVVNVDSVNTLKSHLHKFWLDQPASSKMWMCGLADFQMGKMRMVLQIFLRTWRVKCGYGHNIISWKKDIHFVEIFIVGITLCAIYVRHKTSHRHKSRVNGGTRPPEFVLGGRQWCPSLLRI